MTPLSFVDRKQICVVGYPRSGNTYTARLLGDALNAPITGAYNAVPLAQEGLDRASDYVVRQLHLKPVIDEDDEVEHAVVSGWKFALNKWRNEKVIHIIRDPRDVAISAYYYWQRPSVLSTIQSMIDGTLPFHGVGSWTSYVDAWQEVRYSNDENSLKIEVICYEDLLDFPVSQLDMLLSFVAPSLYIDLDAVIMRQSLSTKRTQIEHDGDTRPYGKAIQLHHLRKGVAGDWRNHFDHACIELAHKHWQEHLLQFHYERDDTWTTTEP